MKTGWDGKKMHKIGWTGRDVTVGEEIIDGTGTVQCNGNVFS